jgi:hypothetical protein
LLLDGRTVRDVFFGQKFSSKLFEHFREPFVKIQFRSQFLQILLRQPIHPKAVEQHFHASELAVVAAVPNQL